MMSCSTFCLKSPFPASFFFFLFVTTPPPSEEQSRLAARKYARVVQKLGFPAKFLDFKIQNMVGSCDVKFPIRLEGLVLTHQQFSRFVLFMCSVAHFCCFSPQSWWELYKCIIELKWRVCFSYEPELFPGLIYRMIKPRIVLLIFVSGKVVLTGKTGSTLHMIAI